jgi:hypothetical protein
VAIVNRVRAVSWHQCYALNAIEDCIGDRFYEDEEIFSGVA